MKTFGNIIWHFPFFGFLFALVYAIIGLIACITIIGIPVGLGLFQFSQFLLSPFSKAMVTRKDLELIDGNKQGDGMKIFSFIVRILYFPFGLIAAISAICIIIAEFITIIGIPSGMVWAKSLSTIFNPVNKVCVPKAVADRIEAIKNGQTVSQYSNKQVNPDASINQTKPSSTSLNPSMIEKAEKKTDDELKEIVRAKEDYNADLVKAAEAVLLSRITGVPIEKAPLASETTTPLPPPNPSIAYERTQSDVNANYYTGAKMLLIALAIPVLGSVISILNSIFLSFPISIIPHTIINCLYILVGALMVLGSLKMLPARKDKPHVGLILIIIAGTLTIISNILWSYSSYQQSILWDESVSLLGPSDAPGALQPLFEAISAFNSIGNIVLYFIYITWVAGIIIWQKECINKAVAKQGALIITAIQVLFLAIFVLSTFGIHIVRQDEYNGFINLLIMIYPLILSCITCLGVYKIAVGMNLIKKD